MAVAQVRMLLPHVVGAVPGNARWRLDQQAHSISGIPLPSTVSSSPPALVPLSSAVLRNGPLGSTCRLLLSLDRPTGTHTSCSPCSPRGRARRHTTGTRRQGPPHLAEIK